MKLRLICIAITASISSLAQAGNVYLAPSLFIHQVSGSHTTHVAAYPKVALGFANLANSIYFAGEVFAVPISWTLKNNHNNEASSARISRAFGASILPGFIANPNVIGYARIGIVTSLFSSPNVYQTGGQLGLGLQSYFAKSWAFRAEYDFSAYRYIRGIGSPHVNEVGVGLIYFFGCEDKNAPYDNEIYQTQKRYPIYKN